tara:strand:- start:1650 stop:2549 length:900 start_codon:yes stop_codon:yes gene_type:complete
MKTRQNQIMIIQAYRYGSTWVFDDEDTDLEKEAFVSGAPEMIDAYLVERFGDTHYDRDIRLLFSAQPFPGACQAKQVTKQDSKVESESPSIEWVDAPPDDSDAVSVLDADHVERVPVDWCDHPMNQGDDNDGFIYGIEYWDGQDVLDVIWYDDENERDYDLKVEADDDWENFTWEGAADDTTQWVSQWVSSLSSGWYETTIAGKKMQGWLCPATLLYFDDYPEEIWYSAEPLSEEDSVKMQAERKIRDDAEEARWKAWREKNNRNNRGQSQHWDQWGRYIGGPSNTPANSPTVKDDKEE